MTDALTDAEAPPTRPGERINQFLAAVEALPDGGKIDATDDTLDALTDIARLCRSALLTVAHERSCVLSVRVLDLVLAHYSVPGARAASVAVLALNMPAVRQANQGIPIADWPDDAYSVGVIGSGAINGKDWDGHLVTVIRTTSNRIILDASAGQFDRPQHNLRVPSIVCWRLPSLWTPQDPATFSTDDEQTLIEYRPSTVKSWTAAKDWNADRDMTKYVVSAVVEAIDAVRQR